MPMQGTATYNELQSLSLEQIIFLECDLNAETQQRKLKIFAKSECDPQNILGHLEISFQYGFIESKFKTSPLQSLRDSSQNVRFPTFLAIACGPRTQRKTCIKSLADCVGTDTP